MTTTTKSLSGPRIMLQLEGLALFIGAIAAYAALRGDALTFVLLLFVPDIAMLGYAINQRIGAWIYNTAHHPLLPGLLIALAFVINSQSLLLVALIWLAHIGMDRAIGYGFKYASAFKDTHLQRL